MSGIASSASDRSVASTGRDRIGERLELDHLVVAAATLDDGVAWCETVLGVMPAAGGRHVFMGTHNRLLSVASARFPRSYLEVIAIDPDGTRPAQPRWFGLDEAPLRRALEGGPRLVHWVARCHGLDAVAARLRALGFDPGPARAAERKTAAGLLRWRITVGPDGRLLGGGAVPTLIEWGDAHPSSMLPRSGVALVDVSIGGRVAATGSEGPQRSPSPASGRSPTDVLDALVRLRDRPDGSAAGATFGVALDTPRGRVVLDSLALEEPR